MYIKRYIKTSFETILLQFPAVMLTGPRQSGKTTFLKTELGDRFNYVTLDDPLTRSFALADPNGFLDRYAIKPVIFDEIQNTPELLPYIKIRIDADRGIKGRFVLTGSQHFQLMSRVSESLAGRVAILELPPLGMLEFPPEDLEMAIWNGFYPEPALFPERRNNWVRSYLQTYVERDIRQVINVRDLRSFEQFVGICMARHGREFNLAGISREAGVTLPTVKSWGGALGASYICTMLSPFFSNYGKRVVKTPKIYFLDPALVCDMTRQPGPDAALSGSMGGALFEGFVINETFKVYCMLGRRPDIYFWRSSDGNEVDLLFGAGGKFHAVEIKLTKTPSIGYLTPLERLKKIMGNDLAGEGMLVCRVDEETPLPSGNVAIPWRRFPERVRKLLEG